MPIAKEELIRTLLGQKTNMMAYIMFLIGDIQGAEDVFQTISLLAYKKSDTIENKEHLMGWLRIAARNESLKTMRNKARSRIRFDSKIVEKLEPHWQKFDHQKSKLHLLQKCMEKLSPKAKIMVKLKYHDGLRGAEIAETLNMSLNAVYVGLSRIHRRLAECVQSNFSQENAQ